MKLNDRQFELATAIREIANVPDSEAWGDFIDFTRAMASMLEGAETLAHPNEMQKRFSAAWHASAALWGTEHRRIFKDCLGGQEAYDRVKAHPNGNAALSRILSRVKETHGNITPGMSVNVDIGDILSDELGP